MSKKRLYKQYTKEFKEEAVALVVEARFQRA
jgi:transposase-like protein